MRSKIKERVRRDGKTAVWLYAPGYYRNGTGCKENVEDLTGFRLERTALGQSMPVSWMLEPSGAATVERDGVRGVFFPLPPDAAALRETFRAAGVHIWVETDDVMVAGRGYAMIHAASGGAKTLRLPCPCNAREVFGASPPHEGVSGITETLRRGETRVWRLEPTGSGLRKDRKSQGSLT